MEVRIIEVELTPEQAEREWGLVESTTVDGDCLVLHLADGGDDGPAERLRLRALGRILLCLIGKRRKRRLLGAGR